MVFCRRRWPRIIKCCGSQDECVCESPIASRQVHLEAASARNAVSGSDSWPESDPSMSVAQYRFLGEAFVACPSRGKCGRPMLNCTHLPLSITRAHNHRAE